MSDTTLAVQQPSAMEILQMAVQNGAQIDTIERLVALQKSMAERGAEIDFNKAMHGCQQKMKRISADMENPQTRSRYASYAQIDRTIRPIYTDEGFSLSFGDGEPIAPEFIRLICYVSHSSGHTRMYHKDMPIVTTGAQGKAMMTAIHAHGSADAYAKRYLVKDIFNLAVGEDDDDGNGKNGTFGELADALRKIEAAKTADELKTVYQAATAKAMNLGDQQAVLELMEAKDAKKEALAK